MSLLSQMYPSPSEKIARRSGARVYDPSINLGRLVNPPTVGEALDPKAPPFRLRIQGEDQQRVYTTPYGVMSHHLMDQFARHCQWKSATNNAYVRHVPSLPERPDKGKEEYLPRSDMVKKWWPGQKDPGGPYDYQQVFERGGLLPETKVWPLVSKQYTLFNDYVGPRADLFREIRHKRAGRTEEETEAVREKIRDLVKEQALNTQYVKPLTYYKGLQDEPRVYEPLERPAGRSPVNMTTETMAQFHRTIPSKEYTRPKFCPQKPLSRSVVLQRPFNHFNHVDHPHSLDYLPMPWNLSARPTEFRLISGYQL